MEKQEKAMGATNGPSIRFYKMQGSGNDFVAIDNRELKIPAEAMPDVAVRVCRRAFGVGADGIFFLGAAPQGSKADYAWQFFNSDGSRPAMCGNASRCAAKLAHRLGIAPARHVLLTDAGPIEAEVLPDQGQVKVQLTAPKGLTPNIAVGIEGGSFDVHFVDTGVPHVVVFVQDLAGVDVATIGLAIRFNKRFAPAGANVNFVQVKDPETLLLRTFERGVEGETYACGTGAAASQVVAHSLGLTTDEVQVTTSGGERLRVGLADGKVFLTGGAELVFAGDLFPKAVGLKLS